MKLFSIKTFGCQMNEYDSERIAGILSSLSMKRAENGEIPDIYIVNTCAVREKSEEKLFSFLGRIKELKKKKRVIIGVTGCVSQVEREKIFQRAPYVDFVLGPHAYKDIPRILEEIEKKEKVIDVRWRKEYQEIEKGPLRESPFSAYITVMEGCNKFCSFCIVPFARGREISRSMENILKEAKELAEKGYKEIQFLGQNIDAYKDPDSGAGLAKLLKKASEIEGIEWIRFITSHPKDIDEKFILSIKELEKVTKYIHLPAQAGSNSVLERMRRGYTREEFIEKVNMIRSHIPNISIGTDIIVGFPGETEEEFEDTLRLLEEVRFDNLYSFKYSPRKGTLASRMKDDVPKQVKIERLIKVQELQKRIQLEKNKSFVGKIIKVLVTGSSKKDPSIYAGRDEGNRVVNFRASKNLMGEFAQVFIEEGTPHSLKGVWVEDKV